MLPDAPPYMKWDEEVARQLTDHNARLQHLERLEDRGYSAGARAFNSVNLGTVSGVPFTITLDSERYDTDNIHDLVNPARLTCRTAGTYAIKGHFYWQNIGGGIRRIAIIRLNGVTDIDRFECTSNVALSPAMPLATDWPLVVGDFVELIAFQLSGVPVNIIAAPAVSPEFMMQRIG